MPSRWRSRISDRSNSANGPITDSSSAAIKPHQTPSRLQPTDSAISSSITVSSI